MKNAICIVGLLICMAACAAVEDYEFGDISREYCTNVSEHGRAFLNRAAAKRGISVPDYCATFGVIFTGDMP